MNMMKFFTHKGALDYAWIIERVDINEFIVTYCRGEVSLDVQYKRRAKGFVVCLDIRIIGPHQFWVQSGMVACDEDKIFWSELQDKEFALRENASDEYATQCRVLANELFEGFPQ